MAGPDTGTGTQRFWAVLKALSHARKYCNRRLHTRIQFDLCVTQMFQDTEDVDLRKDGEYAVFGVGFDTLDDVLRM